MKQFLISIDQVLNVLFGSGWADETLSAYAWRTRNKSSLSRFIDCLFFWDEHHCLESYESERKRLQLPPEYRT